MRSYMISLCVFCALIFYMHGAVYYAKTCGEGKKLGDVWPFEDVPCGQCSCSSYGMQCMTCGAIGGPDGCTYVRNTGAPYPECCSGKFVCPNK